MTDPVKPGATTRTEPVRVGEPAPLFALPAIASDGSERPFSLGEALSRGPVLLVFYRDDGMPVCTRELAAFAQEHDLLDASGVQVYGINTNGLGSHRKFQERDRFPFPLISDFFAETVKAYGFWDPAERKSHRAVVLISPDGLVRHVQPHFNPGNLGAFEEIFIALGLL